MKSVIAVLFALALSCEALYPPAGIPVYPYPPSVLQPEVVTPVQPIQYSYGYSLPSVVAPIPEVPKVANEVIIQEPAPVVPLSGAQVQAWPPVVDQIFNPYISPFPGLIPPASFYNVPPHLYESPILPYSNLAYGYSALPGVFPPGLINGIPINAAPSVIAAPAVYPFGEPFVPPVLKLLNSSYAFSTPYSAVQFANFGSEVIVENKPAVVEIKEEEVEPVKIVAPVEVPVINQVEVLPQKPAVISYEYVIPQQVPDNVVVQEVKPVVPHTVYGVPSL